MNALFKLIIFVLIRILSNPFANLFQKKLAKGYYYFNKSKDDKLTPKEKQSSYVSRLISLRFLPPKTVEEILTGKQNPLLCIKDLYEMVKV